MAHKISGSCRCQKDLKTINSYSVTEASMFDLQTFVIPDNTKMEERTIVVDGGALIGGYSVIEYGIIARGITTGEHVKICGEVSARSDIYIDRWSDIAGAVRANGDAHLGEFVKIHGKLIVDGDLDIGDHVSIKDGFEAKGWIMIRNPIPVIIFLYLYLSELLRLGRGDEVEKALEELFGDESDEIDIRTMVVPAKSRITLSAIEVDRPAHIGNNCRLQGNIRAESLSMGSDTTLFGSIRAKDVTIQENSVIHGNIDSRAHVRIGRGSHILGDIHARTINIHHSVVVDGNMDAPRGIVIEEAMEEAEELKNKEKEPKTGIKKSRKKRHARLSRRRERFLRSRRKRSGHRTVHERYIRRCGGRRH